jgi:hypothetical protein
MYPIEFKEQNKIYGKNQKPYKPIHVFDDGTNVISCWTLSFIERFILLFTGKIWLRLVMFGSPLTPSYITVKKKEVVNNERKTNAVD